ncbi:Uncharacterised protein [Salmonella enterica subsp. enterica]|uniref:Uncharacterized protein n=1 Tax=Salmonella enterica I TaxID=59201 RepID=A0A447U9I7_SALET|nr:Uncharacterised protein [Salmonella enterica subsp. enterica]
MKLTDFMQSDIYVSFLDDLEKSLSEKIDRKSKVHDVVISLMEKWLGYASLSFDDLCWVILNWQINFNKLHCKKTIKIY